ncbi:MAG: helix-turn-helix transcriptional regulator [Dehalococcoidales bacterium]|nr:helix-turn-helix transcriptional regulator [Dehalococcoidales bacterium]
MAGEFGIVLRKLRRELGRTLREVSRDTGIVYTHLNQWENGIYLPRADKVFILAKYYRIKSSTLAEIVRWERQARKNGGYSEDAERFLASYLMNMR